MKDVIVDRIVKLFSVKSIVTVILTVVFSVLSIRGTITGDQFLTVFTVVVAFYFGTQAQKKTATEGKEGGPV